MDPVWGQVNSFFEWAITHGAFWIYSFLFLSAIVENIFPPYPGDAVIFAGGYLASSGHLNWLLVFVSTAAGSWAGLLILFWLGRAKGRALLMRKEGRWLSHENFLRFENWFSRWGVAAIIFGRFLAGIRSGVALAAGIAGVSWKKILIFGLLSVLIWNGILISLARLVENNWEGLYHWFGLYNRLVLAALATVLILWVLRFWRRKKRAAKT
ncbi:MAG: DedA family protein [candidate division Zixibacteria bacterium]|nr:DedA family protein [candidate division Zixibacteria bacterium]